MSYEYKPRAGMVEGTEVCDCALCRAQEEKQILPVESTTWEACTRAELESLLSHGSYGQKEDRKVSATGTAYLHYAHCIKFTPGKLDREPWSTYELREIAVWVSRYDDETGTTWTVSNGNRVIGSGEEREEALADAAYKLMDDSRFMAGEGGAFLKAMNPKAQS